MYRVVGIAGRRAPWSRKAPSRQHRRSHAEIRRASRLVRVSIPARSRFNTGRRELGRRPPECGARSTFRRATRRESKTEAAGQQGKGAKPDLLPPYVHCRHIRCALRLRIYGAIPRPSVGRYVAPNTPMAPANSRSATRMARAPYI